MAGRLEEALLTLKRMGAAHRMPNTGAVETTKGFSYAYTLPCYIKRNEYGWKYLTRGAIVYSAEETARKLCCDGQSPYILYYEPSRTYISWALGKRYGVIDGVDVLTQCTQLYLSGVYGK